jgi:hypothetical protein
MIMLATLTTLPLAVCADTIRFKIGYGSTESIQDRQNRQRRLTGLELGVDLPLGPVLPGFDVYASPSVLMGGQFTQGSDLDGFVYRFNLSARRHLTSEVYGYAAAGVAHTVARGDQFADRSGFNWTVGFGYELGRLIPGAQTQAEILLHQGDAPAFRGYSVGLGIRF